MPTPYPGDPSNFPADVNILSGGDAPNSTNFNTAYEGTLDRTAFLFQTAAANFGQRLSRPVMADPTDTQHENPAFCSPEWDPKNNQWIQGTWDGAAAFEIFISYDGHDENWRSLTGGTFSANPSGGGVCVAKDPNDTTTFHLGLAGGSSVKIWTGTSSGFSNSYGLTAAVGDVQAIQWPGSPGYIVFGTGGTTAAATNFVTSNDKMVTHAVTNIGAMVGAVPRWLLRSSGTVLLAVPVGATFATPFVVTSTDGHTFSQNTGGFAGNLLSTDTIVACDWGQDPSGGCFLMVVQTTGGGPGKILRSPDGVNWTLVTSLTSLKGTVSLAAAGRMWMAVVGATSPAPQTVFYSADGLNWYRATAVLEQPTTVNAFVRSNFAGGPVQASQICVSNRYGARFTGFDNPPIGPVT
jgi:hypothetical protein